MVMTLGSPTGQASTSRPAQAAHHAAPCSRSGRSSRPWRRASGLVAAPGGCAQARRQPPRTLVAASAADVDSAALVPLGEEAKPAPRRPGYRSFVLDSCEFLVAETPDGQLDLQDAYVLDVEGDVYARPTVSGELPAGPRYYQTIEVGAEFLGNVLEEKPPKYWVYRVYFVPVAIQEPYQLDLAQVYLFEDKPRSLSRCPVTWLAPEGTAPHDLRLRVRAGGLIVESVESLPSWEDVVLAHQAGLAALSETEKALLDAAAAGTRSWEEARALVGDEYVRIWQAEAGGALQGADAAAGAAAQAAALLEADRLLAEQLAEADAVDENLKDFMAEYDDEQEGDEFEDFDSPAVDY